MFASVTHDRDQTLQGLEQLALDQDLDAIRQPDGTFLVTIRTSSEAVAMLLEVLRFASLASGRIHTAVRRDITRTRSDETVAQLRADERAVALFYWQTRQTYKHRVAVAITFEECPIVRARKLTRGEIGILSRAYPEEYFVKELAELAKPTTTKEVCYGTSQCTMATHEQ